MNARFEVSDPADWKRMIDVNLYGVLHCTQAATPLLQGRPGAMISSVSSVGGRYGVETWSVYSATKFAVVGFYDALCKGLGQDGIRVSVSEPGAVWTEFGENVGQALRERRENLVVGQFGQETQSCHCEPASARQSRAKKASIWAWHLWIAASQVLLAMTRFRRRVSSGAN